MALLRFGLLRRTKRPLTRLAAVAAALRLAIPPTAEAGPPPTEHQIKAAFLYNFGKFVEWPETALPPGQPLVLGVLGANPFRNDLADLVRGRTIGGRELRVRQNLTVEEAGACHILFISASESRAIPRILQGLRDAPVLTVGETEGFAAAGGVIGFTVEQNKVRFEVNLEAAERAMLRVSSQLLRLARVVRDSSR